MPTYKRPLNPESNVSRRSQELAWRSLNLTPKMRFWLYCSEGVLQILSTIHRNNYSISDRTGESWKGKTFSSWWRAIQTWTLSIDCQKRKAPKVMAKYVATRTIFFHLLLAFFFPSGGGDRGRAARVLPQRVLKSLLPVTAHSV